MGVATGGTRGTRPPKFPKLKKVQLRVQVGQAKRSKTKSKYVMSPSPHKALLGPMTQQIIKPSKARDQAYKSKVTQASFQ